MPQKLDLKRWNAEGCHGREKTKSFWRVFVRIGFTPLACKVNILWMKKIICFCSLAVFHCFCVIAFHSVHKMSAAILELIIFCPYFLCGRKIFHSTFRFLAKNLRIARSILRSTPRICDFLLMRFFWRRFDELPQQKMPSCVFFAGCLAYRHRTFKSPILWFVELYKKRGSLNFR